MLPLSFIEDKWEDLDKSAIQSRQNLNEAFIISHLGEMDFDMLMIGKNLTQNLCSNNRDKVNLTRCLNYVQFTEQFVRDNINEFNLDLVVRTQDFVKNNEVFYK